MLSVSKEGALRENLSFYNLSPEAKESIISFAEKFFSNKECCEAMEFFSWRYESNFTLDFGAANEEIKRVAEKNNFNVMQAHLLLYFCLSFELKEHFLGLGMPAGVFEALFSDLYPKILECHAIYGVWGTDDPTYFAKSFSMMKVVTARLLIDLID